MRLASLALAPFAAATALLGAACTTIVSFPEYTGTDGGATTTAGAGGTGSGTTGIGGQDGPGGSPPTTGSGAGTSGGGGAHAGGAGGTTSAGGASTGGAGGAGGANTGGAGGAGGANTGGGAPDAGPPDAGPPTGACLWTRRFGDGAMQIGSRMARTSQGRLAILGTFGGQLDLGGGPMTSAATDVFTAELDATGVFLWARQFQASNTEVRALALGPGDERVLAGNVGAAQKSGSITFGGPLSGAAPFVAKLDAQGLTLWSRLYASGATSPPLVARAAVAPNGDVVVFGQLDAVADFGAGPVSPAGKTDLFVMRLAGATGSVLWARTFGDASFQTPESLAIDSKGDIVLAGEFGGTLDFGGGTQPLVSQGGDDANAPPNAPTSPGADAFVAKLDASGNALWARRFGDATLQTAQAVTVGAGDAIYVAGEMQGSIDLFPGQWQPGNGGVSIFAASLDAAGATQWGRVYPGGQLMNDLWLATSGPTLWIAGRFTGTLAFDKNLVSSSNAAGSEDVFVAAIDGPFGTARYSAAFGDAATQLPGGIAAAGAEVVVYGSMMGSMDFGCGAVTSAGGVDVFAAAIAP
jgi:hypothetical protein